MASLFAEADEMIAEELARRPRPKVSGHASSSSALRADPSSDRASSSSSTPAASASAAAASSPPSSLLASTRDPRAEPILDGELRLSYLASELINLEIMKRHDGNLWRAHNQDLAQNTKTMAKAIDTLERGIKSVNKKRAADEDVFDAAVKKRQKSARNRLLALGELRAAVAGR